MSLNRREFLGISGASLLSGAAGSLAPRANAQSADMKSAGEGPQQDRTRKRPNLIFFIPDELRADSVGCYGNPVVKTPNMDALAAEGTRFSNCHVQFPVCGGSRCSVMTGWPTSVRGHRSLYYFLRPDEPNMLRYLKQAGYDVFWFGAHNDTLAAQCFSDSVNEWRGGPEFTAPPGGTAYGLTPGTYSMLFPAQDERRTTNDYSLVQDTIRVLERKEQDRPFAIWIPMAGAHPPYTTPPDFYNMYKPADVPAPVPPNLPRKPSFHAGMREYYGLDKLREETFRKIRAVYYGKVSYTDWLLGELMEALARTGRDLDTAMFLFADHGDYTGDYGLVEKWPAGLEDCLTHVPLIVRAPGGKRGHVSEEMVELYDVMQTAIDLAGTRTRHTHFARSLLPQVNGSKGDTDRAAFAEAGYNVYEPQCFEPPGAGGGPYTGKIRLQNERPETVSRCAMVRTQEHKLIVRPQEQSELYAYSEDPQERNNLFDESRLAATQQELERRLLRHFLETSGVAPPDKDPRETPPFYPTREDLPSARWQQSLLDV